MIIKWILIPTLVLAVWLSLRSRVSLRGQAWRRLLALGTAVVGVLAVVFPQATQWAADQVGVGRGADLLLYGLALVVIYSVGSTSARFREQEARLVSVCRFAALAEVEARLARVEVPGFRMPAAIAPERQPLPDPALGVVQGAPMLVERRPTSTSRS